MNRYHIRRATPDDGAAISALLHALTPVFFDDPNTVLPEPVRLSFDPAGCRERISDPMYLNWVAEADARVIGYASLRERRHLYHLFVARDHQRRGAARALWAAMLNECKPGQITVRSSLNAIPVYRQFGFVEQGDTETLLGLTYQLMVRDSGDEAENR
ncbi:MAG: GNAT family N-acetyltransferase [Pseudomonadota bacterium]